MNGELFQICMIVNAARKALTAASCCDVEIDGFVDHTEFRFLPEKALSHTKDYIAHSADDWFSHCQKHGLADIKMLCLVKTDDRTILGYVNTTGSSIVTFYPSSRITFWTAHWEFIPVRKKWKVLYTEHSWDNAPPWYAEEKSLGGKYDQLSDELLKQIRLAILYSINEN